MSFIQPVNWGQVEWFTGGEDSLANYAVSIGVATINPHIQQADHIHYNDARFIYVIQGKGLERVNDEIRPIYEGMYYYLPPNVLHSIKNTESTPLKHLLISVPSEYREVPDAVSETEVTINMSAAIEAIRPQLRESTSMPFAIFDDMGNMVFQNNSYPDACKAQCDPDGDPRSCPCFIESLRENGSKDFICPHGMTVFSQDIMHGSKKLGTIVSGHVFLESASYHEKQNTYDTPIGTVVVMKKWIKNVAKSIVSYCNFDALRQGLRQKDTLIQRTQHNQEQLKKDLESAQTQVSNLKITYHFLFNTLNAIAGLALEKDSAATYNAIIDLSKMLRYSKTEDVKMVQLKSELEYLDTYLHMWKLRYGDRLQIKKDIDSSVSDCSVPFNFLQPIVENAFTHGFANVSGPLKLDISIRKESDRLYITISNNGTVPDTMTVKRVTDSLNSNSGHGLALSYAKLKAAYESDFTFTISLDSGKQTAIELCLPLTGITQGDVI